ncbi:hypothetical protein Tco_1039286 [Tanacetum coccineum]
MSATLCSSLLGTLGSMICEQQKSSAAWTLPHRGDAPQSLTMYTSGIMPCSIVQTLGPSPDGSELSPTSQLGLGVVSSSSSEAACQPQEYQLCGLVDSEVRVSNNGGGHDGSSGMIGSLRLRNVHWLMIPLAHIGITVHTLENVVPAPTTVGEAS